IDGEGVSGCQRCWQCWTRGRNVEWDQQTERQITGTSERPGEGGVMAATQGQGVWTKDYQDSGTEVLVGLTLDDLHLLIQSVSHHAAAIQPRKIVVGGGGDAIFCRARKDAEEVLCSAHLRPLNTAPVWRNRWAACRSLSTSPAGCSCSPVPEDIDGERHTRLHAPRVWDSTPRLPRGRCSSKVWLNRCSWSRPRRDRATGPGTTWAGRASPRCSPTAPTSPWPPGSQVEAAPSTVSSLKTWTALHHKAGSTNIYELHGSAFSVVCMQCERAVTRHSFQHKLRHLNPHIQERSKELRPDGDVELPEEAVSAFRVPLCEACGGGIMKPDIVFFGDNVPGVRVEAVKRELARCDSLLVLGSSLHVYSGYRFILKGAELGLRMCGVNIGVTRADPHLMFRVDASQCHETPPPLGTPSHPHILGPPFTHTSAQGKSAREESAREESAREESAREESAREESAREKSAREESARKKSAREESAREKSAREESARGESARDKSATSIKENSDWNGTPYDSANEGSATSNKVPMSNKRAISGHQCQLQGGQRGTKKDIHRYQKLKERLRDDGGGRGNYERRLKETGTDGGGRKRSYPATLTREHDAQNLVMVMGEERDEAPIVETPADMLPEEVAAAAEEERKEKEERRE
ncbi:hypothetical protein Pcinc_038754, partial [Petrolisthes cinctipes]